MWKLDSRTGAASMVQSLISPTSITSGRRGEVYVLDGSTLRVIDPDAAVPQIGSVAMSPMVDGKVGYNDVLDEVAGVSTSHTQMVFVKWDGTAGSIRTRSFLPAINIQGTPTVVADHETGRFLIKGSLNSVIFIVEDDGTNMALVDQINLAPTFNQGRTDALFVDSNGRIGISTSAAPIVVYESIAGNWQQTMDHPFAGLTVGKHFRLAAGRSNFNPLTMSGPAQLDVIPDQFGVIESDCDADIAPSLFGDGTVGVPDLLTVINGWGPCPGPTPETCPGDIAPDGTGDNQVGVPDLLRVINNWGACP
jgi:hypothetical protein